MRNSYRLLIVISLLFLFPGTTYIIQEDGVEVGRWEENNGSDAIEVISNDAPKEVPKALTEPVPIAGGPGYRWATPEKPEGEIVKWKISGQVIDILRLRGIGAEEIVFQGASERIVADVNFEGYFSAELPAYDQSGYTAMVKAKDYQNSHAFIKKKGSFRAMSYKNRLQIMQQIPMWDPIRGTHFDIQIGMIPDVLTKRERDAYTEMLQGK